MATYEYDCPRCGRFETHQPIGTASDSHDCPGCSRPARRVFSAPHLTTVPRQFAAALEREERSGAEPEVVTEVPPGRPRPAPHPVLSRLPRP
ncbi:FmdB family zinc ribbon protein [Saccharopolyspora sp. ASAGF58]|uniref:FmdB family zinc ribbon protein n=1 Tax=Saccharopolyspora sp. ASAGF58 TaxID=2719023 RepID=UPI001440149D|nr:FmdB family zinc ribbon protein [Saccharopolyspora sp. ASAGF58]QIZ38483.1 zinc ribbon domain-containing protein [Saccharopolyspora sp. ASAGF58]